MTRIPAQTSYPFFTTIMFGTIRNRSSFRNDGLLRICGWHMSSTYLSTALRTVGTCGLARSENPTYDVTMSYRRTVLVQNPRLMT